MIGSLPVRYALDMHRTLNLISAGLALSVFLLHHDASAQVSCGDCSGDGVVNILDALAAAQIGASIAVPTATQTCACDIDSSGSIDVLDALRLAQVAAGLGPGLGIVLVCPGGACGGGANQPPQVTILSPTSGIHTGVVSIVFDLLDPDGDPMTLDVDFSSDAGLTWAPAVTSGTGAIATNPATGVTSAAGLTFDWDTGSQIPVTASVELRITATDGMAAASDQTSFIVDNSTPIPFCQVTTPVPGAPAGDITVSWTAFDALSRVLSLIVEFSTDGGMSWEQASEGAGSSGTSGLTSAPPPGGVAHVFVWRSAFDAVGLTSPETTLLQLTVQSSSSGSICVTAPFNVDNR